MSEVVFPCRKNSRTTHKLIAWLSMEGHLIFEDVRNDRASGCETIHSLMVRASDKCRVLHDLGVAFNGISNTCGRNDDDRLLHTLDRVAHLGSWESLGDIEKWLMRRGIAFTKQMRVNKK